MIRAILVSPTRPKREVQIRSPTINALNSVMSSGLDGLPDLSWDSEDYVSQRSSPGGTPTFTRLPARERHQKIREQRDGAQTSVNALEKRLGDFETEFVSLRRELQTVKAENQAEVASLKHEMVESNAQITSLKRQVRLLKTDNFDAKTKRREGLRSMIYDLKAQIQELELIEKFEVISSSLRAYNETLFDPANINKQMKTLLKENKLDYITRLLDYRPKDDQELDTAVSSRLQLLSPDEQAFCRFLHSRLKTMREPRNRLQHPRTSPDVARMWLEDIAPTHSTTFNAMLARKPQLLERDQTETSIFPYGAESRLERKRVKLTRAEEELQSMDKDDIASLGDDE
ncbi:hypothetical protein MIND_00143700 [Mycena indigotica]|uniref:Uncharacterized protein n=1 Tax=Mycena indigotica TaxID=2126181 RepID=A0A8H6TF71_9AGAR|nr:uncharacterized protein MIND_00143700 [Mycena indigotica]KAF7316251.1 hypothetical protein MIND_00143700 [Mycena indigotica]